MKRDGLDVYFEGETGPIGRLYEDASGNLIFTYTEDASRPLSLSMPIETKSHGDLICRAVFGNMLPENGSLEDVMAKHGIDRGDILGLLYHVGRDCPGAISCIPVGKTPGKVPGRFDRDYDPISTEHLAQIMQELRDHRRLPTDSHDPSPLAGVQGKVALTQLPDGRFALPKPLSGVPTTHIIKVPRANEISTVNHEHRLMEIAHGVLQRPVANVEPITVGGIRGLLIHRFDRRIENGEIRRIHQEDFCQALGLERRLKYERDGGEGGRAFSARAVGTLLSRTAVPAIARNAFFAITILNLAVGNTDNHAKNHAVLFTGTAPVLAPLYDVVPTLIDRTVTHDFSFRIGNAESMADLAPDDLFEFARQIGLSVRSKTARQKIRINAERVLKGVSSHIDDLTGTKFKLLGDMIADQVERIAMVFDLEIAVPERDAFVLSGGGFRTS